MRPVRWVPFGRVNPQGRQNRLVSAEGDPAVECGVADVDVAVTWHDRGGSLTGSVTVRNISRHACRVTGKPGVIPLGDDGAPLDVQTVITLELRRPDHVVLEPGEDARAPINRGGWNGAPAGDQAIVVWGRDRHRTQVTVRGSRQPHSRAEPTNISSSWFRIAR
ncbi:MAG: hypothetical protein JWO98_3619 [Frankiales bacterium]|nr:hypothetical protein [Frankiales bacterium]